MRDCAPELLECDVQFNSLDKAIAWPRLVCDLQHAIGPKFTSMSETYSFHVIVQGLGIRNYDALCVRLFGRLTQLLRFHVTRCMIASRTPNGPTILRMSLIRRLFKAGLGIVGLFSHDAQPAGYARGVSDGHAPS
mgnify:FL=1